MCVDRGCTHLMLPGRATEPALVAHHALHAVRLQPQDGGRVRLLLRHFLDVDRPRFEVEVRMQPHRRVEAALLPRAHVQDPQNIFSIIKGESRNLALHSLLGYAEDVLVHGNADDDVSLHLEHLWHPQPLRGFWGSVPVWGR